MTDDPSVPDRGAPQGDGLWEHLRAFTAARIGLKRAGASLATAPLLAFQLAHARARDAVHAELDEAHLAADLAGLGLPIVTVASAVEDRPQYLLRPDLGRRLAPDAGAALKRHAEGYDVVFVIVDGLSAHAVQQHAQPVLAAVLPGLQADGWRVAPLIIARYGRVAIGDAVAMALRADCVAVLIGERPGLSAPDGMGAYLTWRPSIQTTDAERNCISNIRPDGVGYEDAAFKLAHLLRAMRARRFSGARLKDTSDRLTIRGP